MPSRVKVPRLKVHILINYPKDDTLLRLSRILNLPTVSNHKNIKNWVQGNKPLVRSESSLFLQPVKNANIIAIHNISQSKRIISMLLEKVIPLTPQVASDKVYALSSFLNTFLSKSEKGSEGGLDVPEWPGQRITHEQWLISLTRAMGTSISHNTYETHYTSCCSFVVI